MKDTSRGHGPEPRDTWKIVKNFGTNLPKNLGQKIQTFGPFRRISSAFVQNGPDPSGYVRWMFLYAPDHC